MEQIACHVIGFISPLGKIVLLQGLKFEHNDVLICISIHTIVSVENEYEYTLPRDKLWKSSIIPPPSH